MGDCRPASPDALAAPRAPVLRPDPAAGPRPAAGSSPLPPKEAILLSTRGAYGFRLDGRDLVTYNHADSDPAYLGAHFVAWLRRHTLAELMALARRLVVVDADVYPEPAEQAACRAALPDAPADQPGLTWYEFLRSAQGRPELWDAGLAVLPDAADFLRESLFCEWAYVADLDAAVLEVYRGFNRDPGAQAPRYRVDTPDALGYWGCRLLATFPLTALPAPSAFARLCHRADRRPRGAPAASVR